MRKPRRVFIVPADDPTEKPPNRTYTSQEIDAAMKAHELQLEALKQFRKKPGTRTNEQINT